MTDVVDIIDLEDNKELIKLTEKRLVNKVVSEVNYMLKGAKIELVNDNVKMFISSDFEVIGTREDKLERINKNE